MTLAAAAELCGKSTNTIRSWAQRHGIGRKIGGTWHISRAALRMFLDGDTTALSAYHAGNRTDSAVRSYFEHVGCGALLRAGVGRPTA
ncbi:MAG: helix-turn-helix domain-containing protein [Xanthobacteraceae bacterium]